MCDKDKNVGIVQVNIVEQENKRAASHRAVLNYIICC